MPLYEALRLALQTVWSHKLRSFFTLLGVIVSVAFLVAVVAVIQGMNAYVRDRRRQRVPDPARSHSGGIHRRRGVEADPAAPDHRARGRRLHRARGPGCRGDRAAIRLADADGGRAVAKPYDRRRVRLWRHRPVRA